MSNSYSIDRTRGAELLADWRARMKFSPAKAAVTLSIPKDKYEEYEKGRSDLPLALFKRCKQIETGRVQEVSTSLPRERWVTTVSLMLESLKDSHVVPRLIIQKRWRELQDFMDLVESGPPRQLALTDPALFKALRDAGTRAYLSGIMEFTGPRKHFLIPDDEAELTISSSTLSR